MLGAFYFTNYQTVNYKNLLFCKIICINTCAIKKGVIHLPYQNNAMITKEGKKILKGIIAEEGIKLGELAKKNGLRPEDISRVLNGETKRQLQAQQVLIKEIKKHRPDLIIEELTN